MTINLGDTARDTITGYTGVVISRHEYLNGCVRFALQPTSLDKDGKVQASEAFDVEQLEVIEESKPRSAALAGGPYDAPARPTVPKR